MLGVLLGHSSCAEALVTRDVIATCSNDRAIYLVLEFIDGKELFDEIVEGKRAHPESIHCPEHARFFST